MSARGDYIAHAERLLYSKIDKAIADLAQMNDDLERHLGEAPTTREALATLEARFKNYAAKSVRKIADDVEKKG